MVLIGYLTICLAAMILAVRSSKRQNKGITLVIWAVSTLYAFGGGF